MNNRMIELIEGTTEKLTGYTGVISSDHAYIHKGISFMVTGITGSISAGGTYKFRFKTPDANSPTTAYDQKYIHWRPAGVDGISTGVTYELYEAPTASAGSDATILNRNRNHSRTSQMQAFTAGATVSGGTRVQIIGGGTGSTGSANAGGGAAAEHEILLKPNTDYGIVLTNRSGSTATLITYEFYWYEEAAYGA